MQSFLYQAATFVIMASAAFPQGPAVAVSPDNGVSQKDEPQILQIETELLNAEMSNDPAVFERVLADDCVLLPAGLALTKAKLVEVFHKSQGQAPAYIASQEDMHVFMLGDTAIVMYVKKYALRANPAQIERQDQTDVFARSAGSWKLKISRSSPHQKPEG